MSAEILLVDLGSVFWPVWMASKSQFDAYVHTIDTVAARAENYEHTIICADSPRNWRHDLTAEMDREKHYKANRPPKPPEANIALNDCKERLVRFGYPVVECDNCEADDVIATLVVQGSNTSAHVLSDDKDLYQLLRHNVSLLTRSGVMTPETCERKFGVTPGQMGDLLALCGDTTDNITGCPGVGFGKGALLLQEFGTIAGIIGAGQVAVGRIKGVGPKIVAALFEWDPALAMQLVRLRTDCPIDLASIIRSAA